VIKPRYSLAEIIATLPNGCSRQVGIGLHWTSVVVEVGGELRCGLASTLNSDHLRLAHLLCVFSFFPFNFAESLEISNRLKTQKPGKRLNLFPGLLCN
jgi:hypothetical protein